VRGIVRAADVPMSVARDPEAALAPGRQGW